MKVQSILNSILRWPAVRPRSALTAVLAITVAAVLCVFRSQADTSFENLLPKSNPAAEAMVRALNDFTAVDELLLLVSTPPDAPADPRRLTEYAHRLDDAIHRDPAAGMLIESVTFRVDDQAREFFQNVVAPAGLFYLDPESFAAARKRLTRPEMDFILRQNEAMLSAPGPAAGALAATLLQDPLHLHDFLQRQMTANQPMPLASSSGFLLSRDSRSLLVRIAGKRPVSDLNYSKAITHAVDSLSQQAAPGDLQIDLTGGYAIAAASEKAIRHDMTNGITGSVILLQILFIAAYRRPVRIFLLAFVPVGLGILWGFGVRAIFERMLSPTAAVGGGVLAGLGIDYTIQYLSNYQARRVGGASPQAAAEETSVGMASTLIAAWVTSVIGFGVVGFSRIPALRDFALVGSLGLFGALLATFFVLPPLLVLSDRNQSVVQLRFDVFPLLRRIARRRRLALGAVGGVLIFAVLVIAVPGVRLPSESDLTSMHPRPNAPLEAERKIARVMGVSPGAILVFLAADNDGKLITLSHEVARRLNSTEARAAGITGNFGLANVLPDPAVARERLGAFDPTAAATIVDNFRAAVAASNFQSSSYEPYATFLHLLLTNQHVPSIPDLVRYPQLAKSMVSRSALNGTDSGKCESITLLFTNRDLDSRADRVAVVNGARTALSGVDGATVTGLSVVGLDAEDTVRVQLPIMLLVSGAIVGLFILLHFRNWRDTWLAFSPTLFSLLVLAAIARLTGQTLNMMNLLVIPLLMGIDTDYGIFLVGLTRQAGRISGDAARREMSASFYALGISAASAALGFGSLVFTSVPAIRSLGWAMGIGVAICFCATLLFRVPMLLRDDSLSTAEL